MLYLDKGAEVPALVRSNSDINRISHLEQIGAKVMFADLTNKTAIKIARTFAPGKTELYPAW